MGMVLPGARCLQVQGSPTLTTLWAQGFLVVGVLRALGSPQAGHGAAIVGSIRTQGHPLPLRSLCKDTGIPADP